MRAAEGDGASVRVVAEEVNRMGWQDWAREAIRARIDPLLAAAVLSDEPARVEVPRALVVFYANWGGWFPLEYRRVRTEWRVLRDRWNGGGRARAYGRLLAAVGAPAPVFAGLETPAAGFGAVEGSVAGRAVWKLLAAAEGGEAGPRASVKESPSASGGGAGGESKGGSSVGGGLVLDEPLAPEDAVRDADAEGAGEGGGSVRGETGEEGAGDVIAGGIDGVLPDGARVIPEIGPEAARDGLWGERLREAAGRESSLVFRLRDSWLDSESDGEGWLGAWLEPAVSRSRERAGR